MFFSFRHPPSLDTVVKSWNRKPSILCCLDIWWNQEGSFGLTVSPTYLIRSPSHATFFIKGTRRSSCLSLSSRFQFPDDGWNYSNKLVTFSHRKGGRALHSLVATKSPAPRCSLCSQVQSCVALMACSALLPPSSKCMWLITCSHLICLVSDVTCLVIPIDLRQKSFPHKEGEQEVIRTDDAPLLPTLRTLRPFSNMLQTNILGCLAMALLILYWK